LAMIIDCLNSILLVGNVCQDFLTKPGPVARFLEYNVHIHVVVTRFKHCAVLLVRRWEHANGRAGEE
jgi:hypothetical protein